MSGGIDSATALWKVKNGYGKLHTLTFTYGSKDEAVMVECTRRLSSLAGAEHRLISLPWLEAFSEAAGSALVSEEKGLPAPGEEGLNSLDEARRTAASVWVPARNLVFLSIAASFAESLGGDVDIITGFDREEALTFPDNTLEFVEAVNRALEYGVLRRGIKVVAPLIHMDKVEICREALRLGVPVEFTLSCYEPSGVDSRGRPIHCGRCESCMRRRRGFRAAGEDRTVYRG